MIIGHKRTFRRWRPSLRARGPCVPTLGRFPRFHRCPLHTLGPYLSLPNLSDCDTSIFTIRTSSFGRVEAHRCRHAGCSSGLSFGHGTFAMRVFPGRTRKRRFGFNTTRSPVDVDTIFFRRYNRACHPLEMLARSS